MSEQTLNLPDAADMAKLVACLKPSGFWLIDRHGEPVDDTVYLTEEAAESELASTASNAEESSPVRLDLTVGWTPETGGWSYQTGDNSYTGGAYGYPHWAVVSLSNDSDPEEVAKEILDQLAELVA